MQWKVLEVNSDGQYLSKYRGFLVLKLAREEQARIPLADLNSVIISSNNATLSKQIMCSLAEHKVPLVLCGSDYLPQSITLPYGKHHRFKKILDAQISSTAAIKKRLWQSLVCAKIKNQHRVMCINGKDEPGRRLWELAKKVKSGDVTNVEAQAAKHYWKHFCENRFYRNPNKRDDINILLNYGYIILRSACARALVSAGMLPALGLAHKNIYNPFCLVDDLMEPFRPMVDQLVLEIINSGATQLTPSSKQLLAKVLTKTMFDGSKKTIVSEAIQKLAFSLSKSFQTKKVVLEFCEVPID